jgi:hypothetical protein
MNKDKTLDDLQILENVRNKLYEIFVDKPEETKVGDLLKVIELKKKLSVSGTAEKKFWEMVDKIREKELARPAVSRTRRKRPGAGKETAVSPLKIEREAVPQ